MPGPFVLGAGGKALLGAAGLKLSGLLGGGSSQGQNLSAAGERALEEEGNAIAQRNALIAQLQDLIGAQAAGGRPPEFTLDLRDPERYNYEGLSSNAERNALMELLRVQGQSPSSLSGQALGLGAGLEQGRRNSQQDLARLIGQFLFLGGD